MTTTLTDTQRKILVDAAARPDGGIVLPKRGRAGPVAAKTLLAHKLVREVRARADLPVWRTDADAGRSFSLVLSQAGRELTRASSGTTSDRASQRDDAEPTADGAQPAPSEGDSPTAAPRSSSKLAIVIGLLRRPEGVSMNKLVEVTDWLPHTTRAALTGLRKRGYTVTRDAAEGGSVYRIADQTPLATTAQAA